MADGIPEDDELDESVDDEFSEDEEFDEDDVEDLDDTEDVEEAEEDEATEEEAEPRPATKKRHSDDEDEDEELDDDDVEEDLGEILQARLAAAEGDEDEDEDEGAVAHDVEDRSNKANRVQPKRPEEFVCQSCFLVKHPSQLADAEHLLCADCV